MPYLHLDLLRMIQLQTLGRVRLVGDRTGGDPPPSAQPKRVALLAYLAVMSDGGPVRRDMLLALFWPELGEEEARRALRQSLHYLRRVLGESVVMGVGEELTVGEERFRCDAVEFERLVRAGRPAEALSLYEGDFLAGFHVPDVSAELEEWVDRTRARLRRHAAAAAWAAAEGAESAGQGHAAVAFGRRASELEPDEEVGWRRLMLLQERLGDHAGALRTYDELTARLRREFDAEPSGESLALAEKLRRKAGKADGADKADASRAEVQSPAVPPSAPSASSAPLASRWIPVAALAAIAVTAAMALALTLAKNPREPSLIEAGAIAPRDRLLVADFVDAGGDTALAVAIADAFRVDFAQSPNVQVMTPRQVRAALERMELSADVAVNDSLARELAVREGVKAFVVGRVARIGGSWTLHVELVGAESGEVLAALRETAPDSTGLIGAVDRASEKLRYRLGESLRELRSYPPLQQEVTASLPALRKYTEGMRLFYSADRMTAIPRLEEAIAIDSNFASAHLALSHIYAAIAEPGRAEEARLQAM